MSLDEQQFAQLLVTLGMNADDRKTLTRIEEKLSNHLDNYRREQQEMVAKVATSDQKASAAHNRLDRVIGIGGWTVFLTISTLVLSVLFSMWNINEKRFEYMRNGYAAPPPVQTAPTSTK